MNAPAVVQWTDEGRERTVRWRSERGAPPPRNVVVADDTMKADDAYALACQGIALIWRGDFQNARQMLNALATRVDRKHRKTKERRTPSPPKSIAAQSIAAQSPAEAFHLVRQVRSQRARTLGMLLIELDDAYGISLRRAPDLRQACVEAYGPALGPSLASLRELLGVIGAHEWRRKGIEIPALGGRIHPHYGVFAPIRSEYVDLVAQASLPADAERIGVAFDIGTGTGVLAAVLARRGIGRVVATDQDARALACARENVERLGLAARVDVVRADLFPDGRARLVVCNPPWLPARPSSPLEHGVYDFESRMLLGFLRALALHLEPGGEGWLIMSDLAEHLGLRTRSELLAAFEAGGLKVVERIDARPRHPRASDPADPLHVARQAEVTSLWRLSACSV